MKKILLASLIATLALTACEKKAQETAAEPQAAQTVTETEALEHKHDETAEQDVHDDHQAHDHDHDHDHEGHMHTHAEGDAYQCGNKTVHIAVHDHEGEIEAHLTDDSIVYDLNQDPDDHTRFSTDNGIENNQPMTLTIDGDKARISSNNRVLLDCTKQS